jgi:hypothetical protein
VDRSVTATSRFTRSGAVPWSVLTSTVSK